MYFFSLVRRLACGMAALLVVNSCGINSAGDPPPQKLPLIIQTKPAEAGQVDSIGNQLQAAAQPGYIFQYWEITPPDSSMVAITTDTTTINPDAVESVVAVFDKPYLDYGELTVGPNGRYAYFPVDFLLPSGARKYALIQADLQDRTKQKVYSTDKRIYNLDISYDNRYIAFSFIADDALSTQIYDIETQQITNTIPGGITLDWANTTNNLLVSAENYTCIYDPSSRCRAVPLPPTDNPNIVGLTAAAWSPDDKHLLLARDFRSFNVYNTQTWEYEKVETGKNHVYFDWLDNRSFLTNGTHREGDQIIGSSVLRYSLDALSEAPENFSINTQEQAVSLSPARDRLAYIHDGLNIYDITSGQTIPLFPDHEYSPETLRWIQDDIILFYDESNQMISTVDGAGNVTRL